MGKPAINIDELIYIRSQYRESKNYGKCDELRNTLDQHLVFVFDAPWGQQVYYLTDKFFTKKPENITHRKWLEKKIQDDSRAERTLLGWLESVKASK